MRPEVLAETGEIVRLEVCRSGTRRRRIDLVGHGHGIIVRQSGRSGLGERPGETGQLLRRSQATRANAAAQDTTGA